MTNKTDHLARVGEIAQRLELGAYLEPADEDSAADTDEDVRLLLRLAQPALQAMEAFPEPDSWTREDFRRWLKVSGMTQDQAAAALGMGKRQVTYMASGEKQVLKRTALACLGVLVLQGLARA